jgi:hypothetical protein
MPGRPVAFPPAEGVRISWTELPRGLRAAIEQRLGSTVVSAESQPGGFSPGLASRVRTADAGDAFLKAVSRRTNAGSVRIHRREAVVAAGLPEGPWRPGFRWCFEDGDWVVLAFDVVPGRPPALPWQPGELTRVLDALVELSDALTPTPLDVETAAELFGPTMVGWRELATRPRALVAVAPGWESHLDELVALELAMPSATTGNSLVHLDVRADNVLLGPEHVCFVDWPWASVGARWLDLVAFLPSVAMQGGPDPQTLWAAHPWSTGVDEDAVDAFIAAFAGFLSYAATLPDPPGLPTLRAFQAAQATIARTWLAQRRGWSITR